MINFRYHVVSLAAVFVALAIGLVVGTAAANGPIADNLNDQLNNQIAEKDQLRDDLEQSRVELRKQADFAVQTAPMVLSGKLVDKPVLVVALEGNDKDVDSTVDGVVEMLEVAGAKVTGRLKIREKFTAPSSNEEMLDLAETGAPPSVSGALPNQSDGVDTTAALLAALLVGKPGTPAIDGTRTVLAAFESNDFVSLAGEFAVPAEAVVLVAGAPTTGKDADARAEAALTITTRLEQAGRIVVGGLSATGLVEDVRSDAALTKNVSTVDNTVTAQGQVAVVLALVERLAGKAGHYGIGDGATLLLPKPAGARDGS